MKRRKKPRRAEVLARPRLRNAHLEVASHTMGALAMLQAAERYLAVFRAVFPEISNRSLDRLSIAIDCALSSLVEADDLANSAWRERSQAATHAGLRSSQVRGIKSRELIAAHVGRLQCEGVPRREWIDRISPRLPKRHRLGDAAIQKHLRALGFPGRQERN